MEGKHALETAQEARQNIEEGWGVQKDEMDSVVRVRDGSPIPELIPYSAGGARPVLLSAETAEAAPVHWVQRPVTRTPAAVVGVVGRWSVVFTQILISRCCHSWSLTFDLRKF